MLAYHAWCHYSSHLPRELQEDHDLTRFSKLMVIQYFDAIIHRGDQTVDSATCKLHAQLHDKAKFFGDQMGYTMEMGEHGLKEWAKGASKMALKHGGDNFTLSMSSHVAECFLIKGALDNIRRKKAESPLSSLNCGLKIPTRSQCQKIPHFRFIPGEPHSSHNSQM